MKKIFLIFSVLCTLLFSCSNGSESSSNPPSQKKNSDWLFLFYFDADDSNINDDLYQNLREIEAAFAKTRNEDGSPKEGYASVNALLLWDGISEEKKSEQKFIHADGALYEIGADYTLQVVPTQGNEYGDGRVSLTDGFSVGANTKDLTAEAGSWLAKEPDMSDPATFTNFLKWAKEHYTATNVVVCLQDHGSGTFRETYKNSTALTQALCSDASVDTGRLLTCKNITDALTEAGWTGADKPKILWNDVCLQATAEIAWNYRGCADYYCASPNVSYMPNYYGIFTNIKKDMSALNLGKVIVSSYFERYYKDPRTCPSNPTEAKEQRASGTSMFTQSFISLDTNKLTELKNAVEKLSQDLLAIKEDDETVFNSIYKKYLKQSEEKLEDCKGLAYRGTYCWLNDLGWFCDTILSDNALTLAHESATSLRNLLKNGDDKLIIYAWGGRRATKDDSDGNWTESTNNQMYLTGKKDFISQKDVAVEANTEAYGLTIVGSTWRGWPEQYNAYNAVLNYYDWTGFSESWGKVIKAWWDNNL